MELQDLAEHQALREVQEPVEQVVLLAQVEVQALTALLDLLAQMELQDLVEHQALQDLVERQALQEVQEPAEQVVQVELQDLLELQAHLAQAAWVVHIHYMKLILKYHMDLY